MGGSNLIGGALQANASTAGSVPQANEGQQISNAQSTYGTATGNAAQTMNTATALNQNSQNQLNTAMGQENPMVTGVNNAATQNLNTYGSTFTPLQQKQAQQAQDYTSDANTQQRQGMAVADQNSATQASLANQRASLASEGVDPASVHGSALTQQAALQGAAQAAGASNQSVLQTQATGQGLVNSANQLGIGVGQLGQSEANTGSGIASSNVGATNQTNSSNVNNLTAANTYLGTGVSANNSATQAAQDQFNQQQQTYQDVQQRAASQASGIDTMTSPGNAMMQGGVVGGIPHAAGGGPITTRGAMPMPIVPGTTDTKLIAATPGEFMLPRDVTEFMGHEKLHKLIDSTREKIAERRGIPMHAQLSSAHTSLGV
jgi:hypothetical protein